MINSFLATLHNSPTPPVNPQSTAGDIVWPSPFPARDYTPEEMGVVLWLLGQPGDFNHFLASVQLLMLVEQSVLASHILADDPRITYDRTQLLGQFEDTTFNRSRVSTLLGSMPATPSFLNQELAEVYRNGIGIERLAALVVHFGRRNA